MELAGKYIVLFYGSMNTGAVFCSSLYNLRLLCLQIIRMHKIYIGLFRDSLKQSAIILKMQGIPSHMWNLKPRRRRNLNNFPFQDSKAFHPRCLLAAFKKELKSQADSKKWRLLLYNLMDHRYKSVCMKILHRLSKASHARQDYFIRI